LVTSENINEGKKRTQGHPSRGKTLDYKEGKKKGVGVGVAQPQGRRGQKPPLDERKNKRKGNVVGQLLKTKGKKRRSTT